MDQGEARSVLNDLISIYVSDHSISERLRNIVQDRNLPRVPVRGVIDDIIKSKSDDFSKEDKEKIDDLMYYFG
jgi:hypothetical protein